jgi:hypothetical protein
MMKVQAITEDENNISMRNADDSRERPKLEGLDFESDDVELIEVSLIISYLFSNLERKRRVCIQCRCE